MLVSYRLIAVLLLCGNLAAGLYEDQAGKWDWRQRYVGKINRVLPFHLLSPSSSSIVVTTDKNVVASISVRNGSLIWRQVLEDRRTGPPSHVLNSISSDHLLYGLNGNNDEDSEPSVITISGNGQYIRTWDVTSGLLLNEITVSYDILKGLM